MESYEYMTRFMSEDLWIDFQRELKTREIDLYSFCHLDLLESIHYNLELYK